MCNISIGNNPRSVLPLGVRTSLTPDDCVKFSPWFVHLIVCSSGLSVSLYVSKISQRGMDGFQSKFVGRLTMGQRRDFISNLASYSCNSSLHAT